MNAKSIFVTLAAAALASSAYAAEPLPVKADNRDVPVGMPLSRADTEMRWAYGSARDYIWRDTDWEINGENDYVYDSEGNNVEMISTNFSGYSSRIVFSDFVDGLPGTQENSTKSPGGDFVPSSRFTNKYTPLFYGLITESTKSDFDSESNTWSEPYVIYRRDIETDDNGRLTICNSWNHNTGLGLYLQQGIEYHYADAVSREPIGFTIKWQETYFSNGEWGALDRQLEVTGLTWERYDAQTVYPTGVLELNDPDTFRPLTATVTEDGVTTVTTYTYDGNLATGNSVSGNERTVFKRLDTGRQGYRMFIRRYVDDVPGYASLQISEKDEYGVMGLYGGLAQQGADNPIAGNLFKGCPVVDAEHDRVSEVVVQKADLDIILDRFSDIGLLEDLFDADLNLSDADWSNDTRTVYGDWVRIPVVNSIEEVEDAAADNDCVIEYFTLDGRRVANPAPGIVIERRGTTATKRLIR